MELAIHQHDQADLQMVGLKAFSAISEDWGLSVPEAAALADLSASTWKRARRPGYAGVLTRDQLLRLSALVGVYKALRLLFDGSLASDWPSLPNAGPLFDGARPVDAMIRGGLPAILQVRGYLDALRGGL